MTFIMQNVTEHSGQRVWQIMHNSTQKWESG